MRTLKLFEDEKYVDEIEVPESFGVVRSVGGNVDCWTPYMEYMPYSEQFTYRREYQDRAEKLVAKYSGRLVHVEPKRIAFAVDEHWELSEKNTPKSQKKINITRAGKLFALGETFDYIIHMRQYWLMRWSDAQINAAIMSQLLLINPKGGLIDIPADAVNPLVATLGADYLAPQTVIPDLLKEDIQIREFRRADGQMTFEELEPVVEKLEIEEEAEDGPDAA